MKSLSLILTALVAIESEPNSDPKTEINGEYSCVVFEKAGITSIHLEGSDPPTAYLEHEVQSTFGAKIEVVTGEEFSYKVTETNKRGKNPDRTEYQTINSFLHGPYYGDGRKFTAAESQAFLRFNHRQDSGFYFYHAGFEYPGGEDVRLSARYGECKLNI